MAKFEPMVDMQIDEESTFNIFEMSIGINESMKEVVNKELQLFIRFQVDVKDIKWLLKWWAKHEFIFPILAFLAC
jgi:hypothetical protein